MKKLLLIMIFVNVWGNIFSQNISIKEQPIIWLRADKNVDSLQWHNFSNPLFNVDFPQNYSAQKDKINFSDAYVFNAGDSALKIDFMPAINQDIKVYAVFHTTDSFNELGLWSIGIDSSTTIGLTTNKIKTTFLSKKYTDTNICNPNINALNQQWRNINIDSTYVGLRIAGTDSFNFNGKFAEFLLFSNKVSKEDNEKIHTYLAVKYGITIHNLNYVDENSEIIWDTDLLQGFNNDVAAIYRNDSLDINQKQSCGNGGLAEISFYIDNLEEDNNLNNSFIQNKEYLFFGHNNDSLKTSNNDSLDASLHVFDLLQRRWMVKANGDSLKNTNINIKFNVSQLDSFDNISLVINRQANNEFLINNCDFYLPDSVDNDNNYYFTNIKWDTDSSGFDMFTFQLSSQSLFSQNFDPGNNNAQNNSLENEIEVELYPNPTDKKFKIHFKTANFNNYTLEIFDVNGRLIEKEEIDISNHHFLYREIKTKGLYYITIYNNQESVTKKIIIN